MSCEGACMAISSSFLLLTVILIIGGNLLVGLTILRLRTMKTVTNMFVLNLALCDLFNGVFNCPLMLVSIFAKGWILGGAVCKISAFLNVVFCCASILTLTAISIDRYFCITKPTRKLINKARALRMTVGIWVYVIALGIVPLVGWNNYVYIDDRKHCMILWNMGGKHSAYGIFLSSSTFVVPTWIMVICYYHIFKTARAQSKKFTRPAALHKRQAFSNEVQPQILNTTITEERNVVNKEEDTRASRERKTARTILIVIGVFQICWFPYAALNLWSAFSGESPPGSTDLGVSLLAYFNSACNPIIYTIFNHRFRKGFIEVLQCISRKNIQAATESLKEISPLPKNVSSKREKTGQQKNQSDAKRTGDELCVVKSFSSSFLLSNNN